ncbi:MAG: sugar phosphate nucleotidyltransferase [Thermoplasmata archaeon]
MIDKVVIPAAGKGTRVQLLANGTPKEMLRLGRRAMIEYAIDEAIKTDIGNIGIIINKHKEIIKKYLWDVYKQSNITYFYQSYPYGLGDAIKLTDEWIDEPYAVILPDEIILGNSPAIKELIKVHFKYGTSVIGVTNREHIDKYGVIYGEEIDEGIYRVKKIIEKPSRQMISSNMVILGRYILSPKLFEFISDINPRTQEVELTDALNKLLKTEDIYAVSFKNPVFDCGNMQGIMKFIDYIQYNKEMLA